jgi:methyl-accepting chemotaxis protein
MPIRLKLLLAITVTLLCLGTLTMLGRASLLEAEDSISSLANHHMVAVDLARSAQLAFARADRALSDAQAAATLSQADAAAEVFRKQIATFGGGWSQLQVSLDDEDRRQAAAQIGTRTDNWQRAASALLTRGSPSGQLVQHVTLDRQRDELSSAIDRLVADTTSNARDDAVEESASLEARSRNATLVALVAGAGVLAGLVWVFHSVSTGISAARGQADRISAGDLETVRVTRRRDEFGVLLKGLDGMREQLRQGVEAEQQARLDARQRGEAAERRTGMLDQLTSAFESRATVLVELVGAAANTLRTTAGTLGAGAADTDAQAACATSAAEAAGASADSAANAAEQLASAITEISRQVAQSTQVAGRAVADARRTDGVVKALAESADRVGTVVRTISNIATQTNLLALNATIEAARAGDAGKGFAVVASEVKNLATLTSKATDEVGQQITQIQSATTEAVEAISGITRTIEELSGIAAAIAAAVEEQSAATKDIASSVHQAASSAGQVADNIGGVSQGASVTRRGASDVQTAAGELSRHAGELSGAVTTYISGVKAA